MPWKVFPVEGGFKVWKIDDNGDKVGDALSKKPMSKEAAAKQAKALYASEAKEDTSSFTITGGDTFSLTNVEDKETKMFNELGEYAMGGGPTTWDEMEAMEETEELTEAYYSMNQKMGMMAHNIMRSSMIEDKAKALADLATGYAERVKGMATDGVQKEVEDEGFIDKLKGWLGLQQDEKVKLKATKEKLLAKFNHKKEASLDKKLNAIRNSFNDQFKESNDGWGPWVTEIYETYLIAENDGKLYKLSYAVLDDKHQFSPRADWAEVEIEYREKSLYIWKEADAYHWLAAYSNNRRDNDSPPEIISTESHKEFDIALQENKWPMPELWLWHIPYPVGITQYHAYDESTGFPVAAGTFYKGMEWAAEGISKAEWDGVSHGMPSSWIKRSDKDKSIIVQHRTKEITFLPLWAAANKLTFSIINKENAMSDDKGLPAHKRTEFVQAFGEERVKQIEAALAEKSKEADEAGIEKKEDAKLTADSEVVKALEMVMAEVISLRQDVDTRLKAIEVKAEEEEPFDLITFLKSKSAVGKPENKVDGRSKEAKDGPEETTPETPTQVGLGIPVNLIDSLVQANQNWYEGGKR